VNFGRRFLSAQCTAHLHGGTKYHENCKPQAIIDQSVRRSIILYYMDRRCPWDMLVIMQAVYFQVGRQSTCDGFQTTRGVYVITNILLVRCL